MVSLGLRLVAGEVKGPARVEGYIPRGVRKNFIQEKRGGERAVEMLIARLKGEPFRTEYEMPVFNKIPPAPALKDLKNARIALVSNGGLVPLDVMRELEREGVYGGLHPTFYTTTGTGTAVSFAEKFGQEIGEDLKKAKIDAVILTST